ncbi:btb (poz) domain-containing 2a-related [Anaeramoeba flamelloides]|uniref:Btb (Poz) domain-containing 2a-related n=1 Tax=Anaeramoeba flamelloides TaxID=1746091 RepID=A0ABQ8Y9H4_9EUKA|nr:btb (poz) domain-containing 2a-related [Anaeramoeba flamelloides]
MAALIIPTNKSDHKLREKYSKFINNSKLSDITFLVGDEKNQTLFFAHKFILATTSKVWSVQLYGNFQEAKVNNKDNPILIPDLHPKVFECLLQYCYTQEVELNCGNAVGVLHASERYELLDLKNISSLWLVSQITIENCCLLLEHAIYANSSILQDKCSKYLEQNAHKILTIDKDFSSLSMETVKKIMSLEKLIGVKEIELFRICVKWGKDFFKKTKSFKFPNTHKKTKNGQLTINNQNSQKKTDDNNDKKKNKVNNKNKNNNNNNNSNNNKNKKSRSNRIKINFSNQIENKNQKELSSLLMKIVSKINFSLMSGEDLFEVMSTNLVPKKELIKHCLEIIGQTYAPRFRSPKPRKKIKILLLSAESNSNWLSDVKTHIKSGGFEKVDVFRCEQGTPSYSKLIKYDALFTFSQMNYFDSIKFGDILSKYVKNGRGLVVATFATEAPGNGRELTGNRNENNNNDNDNDDDNEIDNNDENNNINIENEIDNNDNTIINNNTNTGNNQINHRETQSSEKSLQIKGKIFTKNFLPFLPGSKNYGRSKKLGNFDRKHPIMNGVSKLSGGRSSYRSNVKLNKCVNLIASWNDGIPLVAEKQINSKYGRVVELNFFPVSSRCRFDFWDVNTDGQTLICNALEYTSFH